MKHNISVSSVNIPTIPKTYLQLHSALNNPDAKLDTIANLIKQDIGLTSRLLRLANSPALRMSRKLDNIQQAVFAVGIAKIRDLALTATVLNVLSKDVGALGAKKFWDNSLWVASIADSLEDTAGLSDRKGFLLGMLHNVGWFVLATNYGDKLALLLKEQAPWEVTEDQETAVFGFTHSDAGAMLAQSWNFSDALILSIRNHHKPVTADTPDYMAALVLADMLSLVNDAEDAQSFELPEEDIQPMLAKLALTEAHLPDVLSRARAAHLASSVLVQ